MTATTESSQRIAATEPWRGFRGTTWRDRIDVADFIRANVRPYTGEGSFLSGPTARRSTGG